MDLEPLAAAVDDPSFTEARASAMASIVLGKTLELKPGETVTIEAWTPTVPWALAFVREARRRGARPLLLFEDEASYFRSTEEAPAAVLGSIGRHELALLEKTDAYVYFWGPSDTPRFEALDEKLGHQLTAFQDAWYTAANRGRLRYARMYLGRVSPAAARHYHVGYAEWREELVEGTLVDPDSMHAPGIKIASRLEKGERLTIDHPNGTHLELGLKHRRPQVYSGKLAPTTPSRRGHGRPFGIRDTPVPAGVVVVAVDEETAEGLFRANAPTHSRDNPWWGARWDFTGGRLVSHEYRVGQAEFDRAFAKGRNGRERPGAISIGLNPKIHEAPLMVDQELGTVTLSLGSNRMSGGTTDAGFFTWASLRGADVRVDGHLILRRGRIAVG